MLRICVIQVGFGSKKFGTRKILPWKKLKKRREKVRQKVVGNRKKSEKIGGTVRDCGSTDADTVEIGKGYERADQLAYLLADLQG